MPIFLCARDARNSLFRSDLAADLQRLFNAGGAKIERCRLRRCAGDSGLKLLGDYQWASYLV